MKSRKTVETERLRPVEHLLTALAKNQATSSSEARFQLLEACAARVGGFDLDAYQHSFGVRPARKVSELMDDARVLVQALERTGIPTALCLSALARDSCDQHYQRRHGVYHTDFRLALHLARTVEPQLEPGVTVLDPACGAGMLLAAVCTIACSSGQTPTGDWLARSVYAADLSENAIRGTLLSLASLTDEIDALESMRANWRVHDSLLTPDQEWHNLARDGFNVVVANPPWERLRLTRHEYLLAKGLTRNYGTRYDDQSLSGYQAAKFKRAVQAKRLVERYPSLLKGEPDLYVAFTELLLRLTKPGGTGALLAPGGLIRSQNTEGIRRHLTDSASRLSFTVMANRARHFAIDTRFKFLLVNYRKRRRDDKVRSFLTIRHAAATEQDIASGPTVSLPLGTIRELRPDLTLPEVRTPDEWRLFNKMQAGGGVALGLDASWSPSFCREVDMTHGRQHFLATAQPDALPVVEGRMIQAHRFGCKSYVSGEGRAAKWRKLPPGESRVEPQFWLPFEKLRSSARGRTRRPRAGFCDITGQTNERSMMAALIPPGVVCGNKVPTLEFPQAKSDEHIFLWLGIVNSLPFDWLLRRVVTTTVNYFVLRSLRLPSLKPAMPEARRLAEISRQLASLDQTGHASPQLSWRVAGLRAEADAIVAAAYRCSEEDLHLMIEDFPLLDRGQPHLPAEAKSTVTADLLISTWRRSTGASGARAAERVRQARRLGAMAYLSSEFAHSRPSPRATV